MELTLAKSSDTLRDSSNIDPENRRQNVTDGHCKF